MTATLPNPTDEAPAPSTRVYFSKALLTSKIMVGDKVPRYPDWEPLDGNQGVISLDSVADAEMISGLNKCVSDQMGGVLKISSEEYETLKKNRPWKESAPKSWLSEPLKVAGRQGFKPPEPKPSIAAQSAAPAKTDLPAIGAESDVPQKPPDQPDFKAGGFKPATARVPEKPKDEK